MRRGLELGLLGPRCRLLDLSLPPSLFGCLALLRSCLSGTRLWARQTHRGEDAGGWSSGVMASWSALHSSAIKISESSLRHTTLESSVRACGVDVFNLGACLTWEELPGGTLP